MKAATYVSAGNLQLLDQAHHPFKLSEVEKAYDVFKHVGETKHQGHYRKWYQWMKWQLMFVHSFLDGPDILVLFSTPPKANDSLQNKFVVL